MISVTPLTKRSEARVRRVSPAIAITIAIAVTTLVTIAAGSLSELTGDTLSASVLVITALVTMIAAFAPRDQARRMHG